MRVSTRENDPGYEAAILAGWWKHLDSGNCKIFVDGVDVTDRCSTADEEQGVAFCYKINEAGQKYVDKDLDQVASQALYGKVEIQIPGRHG